MNKLICFLGLFLLGCNSTYNTNTSLDIQIEKPRPLVLKEVSFQVIQTNDKHYIALDSQNYSNLSYNMLELQRFIKDQNLVIETYEKYKKWLHC